MATIRSFEAPHKGLRNVLARFSLRLGYTDFTDPQQLAAIRQTGREMFTLLNDHVHTENEHTLRHLEARVPGASAHDKAGHEALETVQDALEKQLNAFTGKETPDEIHSYYLAFSRFQSQYLEHIYEEETVTEKLLQQHFTDEELTQHRNAVMQRIEFPVLLLWLKYTIPALQEPQAIGMLAGFKANAPQEAFEQVMAAIKPEIEPARFQRLTANL